jgi:hypothetical protein
VAGHAADPVPTAVEQGAQGEQAGRDDEGLGDGGVADGVGVRDSAVPAGRSDAASESVSRWSRELSGFGVTQGVRKPGVWEPCPGHTITITYLVSQSFAVWAVDLDQEYGVSLCVPSHKSVAGSPAWRVLRLGDRSDDERRLEDERLTGTRGIPTDHL